MKSPDVSPPGEADLLPELEAYRPRRTGPRMDAPVQICSVALTGQAVLPEVETNDYYEIVYCREGEGCLLVGPRALLFRAGELLMFPADVPHSRLNPGAVSDTLRFLPQEPAFFQSLPLRDDGSFAALLALASAALSRGGTYWRSYAASLGNAMLRLLLCLRTQSGAPVNFAAIQLKELIQEHFADPAFDLAGAIAHTGYCEGYVRRLFRQDFGMSPGSYLNLQRVNYAKALLRTARRAVTVRQISQRAGFRDPYYFSRLFRKLEGVSPTEYLERLEAEERAAGTRAAPE